MIWNVIRQNFNTKEFEVWNVFNHGKFYNEVMELAGREDNYSKFAEELRKITFYYFASKCEYEIIIASWPPRYKEDGSLAESEKIDIYDQLKMNSNRFVEYVWECVKHNV